MTRILSVFCAVLLLPMVDLRAADPTPAFESTVPEGWIQRQSDKKKTKWWITTRELKDRYPVGMIMVDVGVPTDSSLQATVDHWIENYGGAISDAHALLDGVSAVRVSVTEKKQGFSPKEALILLKDDHVFVITGGGMPDFDVGPAFLHVMMEWRWK